MSQPTVSKEFTVSREDFSHIGEASSQVKMLLKQIGFPSQQVRRVAIAMYEGEVNMCIHANGGTARADIFPDRIEVTLADIGPGIKDVELAMKEGYSTASDEARSLGFGAGMGLANMKKNADQMHIDTILGQGTTVHLVLYTDQPAGT